MEAFKVYEGSGSELFITSATFFWQKQVTRPAQILGGIGKTHCKRCVYREGWKIQAILAIHLPYYLKSFHHHQEVITMLNSVCPKKYPKNIKTEIEL